MNSPFVNEYRFIEVIDRNGYWREVSTEENILSTEDMESSLEFDQFAYVVNHRGYKAHVRKRKNGNMNWHYPPQRYVSEYYRDENADQLKWIIR